jgi:hypothetical protein
MRYPKVLRSMDQLALFRARPRTPSWTDIPAEGRVQTIKLLVRLLRQHQRILLTQRIVQEVRDE